MSYNKGKKVNNKKSKKNVSANNSLIFILLSFVGVGIIPMLVELVTSSAGLAEKDWFSGSDIEYDFFLICKMSAVIVLMLVMLLMTIWQFNKRSSELLSRVKENRFIISCMGLYIIFALLSSCLAKSVKAAFLGGYAQHEPFFVLLGYIVFALFAYLFINGEQDIMRFLRIFVWGVFVIAFLGVLQFLSSDFFNTEAGKSLITMLSDITASQISLSFGEGRVYMTLYNPNYVGSYVALVIPVMIAGVYIMKRLWEKVLMGVTAMMLVICLIGSASTTGMTAIALSIVLLFVLCIPKLKAYRKPIIIVLAGALAVTTFVCVVNSDRIKEAIDKYTLTNDVRLVTAINLGDNEVNIRYKDTDMYVTSDKTAEGGLVINVYDSNHEPIPYEYNAETGYIVTQNDFFKDICFSAISLNDGSVGFNITCGAVYTVTNDTGDGLYYFYNGYGKKTRDIVNARSFGFEGHESFASNRGFIWSRSIPLLADNILFGCGPDNFVREFPNNDYVSMYNNTYSSQVVTRPHNMYLQVGVQTGVLSLIVMLVMYITYFIQSVRLLWRYEQINTAYIISMGILIGSFGYMVCGIANDSTICVAPVFWTFIGLGLAVNRVLKAAVTTHE